MLPLVVPPSKRVALELLRCSLFQTSYNPTGVRTGAKYLRRRLRGPPLVAYYPPDLNMASIVSRFPQMEMRAEDEETRIRDVEFKRSRGKGPPKKAKDKATDKAPGKKK